MDRDAAASRALEARTFDARLFRHRLSHSGARGNYVKVSRGVGIGSMNALEGPKNVSEEYVARTEVVRGISQSDYMTYILNDRMG